ncbi:MAG: hypothetical protein ACM3SR_09490 [Ignavibacteriales bacterium]|jgi:hypothetical protein
MIRYKGHLKRKKRVFAPGIKMKPIQVWLPETLHDRLTYHVVKNDSSISCFVETAIETLIERLLAEDKFDDIY